MLTRRLIMGFIATSMCIASTQFVGCRKSEPQATPESAIEAFYNTRIASGAQGTPSVEQLEQLQPYISTELHELLQLALLNHNKLSSRTVQQRRTFAEGDLFSSLFDGPTSFIPGAVEPLGADQHLVSVKLISGKQLPALNWIDKVKVVRENGHYVVADIEYINHWAFGSNTKLVSSLQSAIGKHARKSA